eukprot:6182606-Pleurochrysis_carterae.AAC.1
MPSYAKCVRSSPTYMRPELVCAHVRNGLFGLDLGTKQRSFDFMQVSATHRGSQKRARRRGETYARYESGARRRWNRTKYGVCRTACSYTC